METWLESDEDGLAMACDMEPACRDPEHRVLGHFAPGHSNLSRQNIVGLLWGLMLCLTSVVQEGVRSCMICKGANTVVKGGIRTMLKHVRKKHGFMLGCSNNLTHLCANLKAYKQSNPVFKYGCPIRNCTASMSTLLEQVVHFYAQHSSWTTSRLVSCSLCFLPLLDKTLEQHCLEGGLAHNVCCGQATYANLSLLLNHNLAVHFFEVMRTCDPNLRTKLLAAIYSRSSLGRWALICPLVPDIRLTALNNLIPDMFAFEYIRNFVYTNPRAMIDFLYDQTLSVKHVLNYLDSAMKITVQELDKIRFELLAGYFYRGLNNFMYYQRQMSTSLWYLENMAWWQSHDLHQVMQELCLKCMDTGNHTRTPHLCFNRLSEKGFGNLFRIKKDKSMLDPKKHLFFAASETFNVTAGPSWHSLGNGNPENSYNVFWSPAGVFRPLLDDPNLRIGSKDNYLENWNRVGPDLTPPCSRTFKKG
jgi:hypothetical protein